MYAELKCKSNFSFLRGASHPDELVTTAEELGLVGVALADVDGVYGIPKAYWAAKNFKALKLIVGAELTLTERPPLTLLAQDRAAYGLLCRILTQSHAGKEKGKASLEWSDLLKFMTEPRAQGLIALPDANSDFLAMKEVFGSQVYFPLSRWRDGHDSKRVKRARALEKELGVQSVATNDVLYHAKGRRSLQDAVTSVREGRSLLDAGFRLQSNAERYLKSPFEMRILFKDEPDALKRTVEIAERCTFSPSELRYRYPTEWIPVGQSAQSYLEELALKGAKERYRGRIPDLVMRQLKHELTLIQQLSFADYFLTIFDIVDFARKKEILCQGRGSAANSVVCYCLGITAIDPVQMNLLFERFISTERGEPPDIDVDFEHERREEVIQYIYEKYGRDRAGMVSAVVTYQKRSTLREMAKVFGIDVGTLSAKKLLKDFSDYEKQSPIPNCREQIEKLSEEMATFPRHLSIHSGGFTLSADPITEIVPIEPARMPGRTIIQWDKYDLDYLGLLKVDVLALGMLSALRKTLDMTGQKLHEIPHDDFSTYEMIQKADTVGTFQVESRAQMNMSGRLMPKTFYDLVVQVAIVRPGPIVGQMVHPYLKRRRGLEKVIYPHPKLREILGKTLGVPLFQEQLMKIAIELGGFSPGESDRLRRAIGAWRSSGSIEEVGARLLKGLRSNGVPEDYALSLLEHMKGFAHYGFPESHAASFALLTYASCYLKRHSPAEFACGLINSWPMGFYHPHSIIDDAKRHGVKVLPIDPNISNWDSQIENGKLRLGLRVVQGLAKSVGEKIVALRPYKSLADFLARLEIRSDVLYRLALGDALRVFGEDQRHTLWRILSERVKLKGEQLDLFSAFVGDVEVMPTLQSMNALEEIKEEYSSFSVAVKGHPMEALRRLKKMPQLTTRAVKQVRPKTYVKTAGLLLVRQRPPTANGVCFAAIEDETGFLDLVLFKKEFEKFKDVFLYQCFLKVSGFVERDGHSVSLIVKNVEPIFEPDAKSEFAIEPTQYFW